MNLHYNLFFAKSLRADSHYRSLTLRTETEKNSPLAYRTVTTLIQSRFFMEFFFTFFFTQDEKIILYEMEFNRCEMRVTSKNLIFYRQILNSFWIHTV